MVGHAAATPSMIRTRLAVLLVILVALAEVLAFQIVIPALSAVPPKPSTSARAADPAIVDAYLHGHALHKLQIGAGTVNLDGWLNTDIEPSPGQVYLDATRRFPLPDGTFRYVYAEQLIEHLTFDQGQFFLKECLRVLQPGGRIRLATPNLRQIVALFDADKTPVQKKLMAFEVTENHLSSVPTPEAANLNLFVRAWGHQFLYDPASLHAALEAAGFTGVKDYALEASDEPQLRDLESHWKVVGGRDLDEYVSQWVEAAKP